MDNVTISYSIAANGLAPNNCKAETTYQGQDLVAHGPSWATAKSNLIARCEGLKALGVPPADETVDLDPPVAASAEAAEPAKAKKAA